MGKLNAVRAKGTKTGSKSLRIGHENNSLFMKNRQFQFRIKNYPFFGLATRRKKKIAEVKASPKDQSRT